eukprot:3574890-Pleurochrysis_carterae.AAC.2
MPPASARACPSASCAGGSAVLKGAGVACGRSTSLILITFGWLRWRRMRSSRRIRFACRNDGHGKSQCEPHACDLQAAFSQL